MGVSELNYVQIGLRIREARNAKGWPQAELAFRAGLNSAYVSHIETGKTKLALPTIVKIANALSVSTDELLCDSLVQTQHVYDNQAKEKLLRKSSSSSAVRSSRRYDGKSLHEIPLTM